MSNARELAVQSHTPRHSEWPYKPSDFTRYDESPDTSFYSTPRFGAHIDGSASDRLISYYRRYVPCSGTVLDLCTSWNSYYFPTQQVAVKDGEMKVLGIGLNAEEMERNWLFNEFPERFRVVDLNSEADRGKLEELVGEDKLRCVTCGVSIDYIVDAVDVLKRIKAMMEVDGRIHLVVSSRCFPSKAVKIWLEMNPMERLNLVGDYLHFAGWKDIEIVDLCAIDETGLRQTDDYGKVLRPDECWTRHLDPLWVVRGTNK